MSLKTSHVVLAALAGGLLMQGCYMMEFPAPPTNFLTGGDEEFADLIRGAAADWARHGLEIANYVTVNDGIGGVVFRRMPRKYIEEVCGKPSDPTAYREGCAPSANGQWEQILVADDATPERLIHVIRHEMLHALLPGVPHNPDPKSVFAAKGGSNFITRADMAYLAQFTDVRDTGIRFVEDGPPPGYTDGEPEAEF